MVVQTRCWYCQLLFLFSGGSSDFSCGSDHRVSTPSGYVQGMSDLLSPILFVMENEVDAFWCFVSFMDQMVRIRTGFILGSDCHGSVVK